MPASAFVKLLRETDLIMTNAQTQIKRKQMPRLLPKVLPMRGLTFNPANVAAKSLNLIVQDDFGFSHALGPAVAVAKLGWLGNDVIERRDARGDEDVSADSRAAANDGLAAED